MKTFEERYTAWIDGQLEGSALAAFEQELTRRAAEGEAEVDKIDAARLRTLLQDHLQAPALTNPDFFNHQLRERIEAEQRVSSRGRASNRPTEPTTLFAWGLARLIGLGALSLFAAAALYYGMMPSHVGSGSDPVTSGGIVAVSHPAASDGKLPTDVSAIAPAPQVATPENHDSAGSPALYAQLSPSPSPIDLSSEIKAVPDIKTYVPDQPVNPTTITPLHYTRPNVNVLWLNGLEYLPNVPDASASPATNTPAATSPVPQPSASASP